jgi:hypothetical protein
LPCVISTALHSFAIVTCSSLPDERKSWWYAHNIFTWICVSLKSDRITGSTVTHALEMSRHMPEHVYNFVDTVVDHDLSGSNVQSVIRLVRCCEAMCVYTRLWKCMQVYVCVCVCVCVHWPCHVVQRASLS